ncbi:hypothetical protein HXX01_05630 [Candidatus Nomurabacteria bacterium]|nr:hypothetical protein [Candidatus Nomurabacteria bacterium]
MKILIEAYSKPVGKLTQDELDQIMKAYTGEDTIAVDRTNQSIYSLSSSFTYRHNNKNYPAIMDMYDSLKKNHFIAQDTDKKDFRKIFENSAPGRPIEWKGTLSDLAYFIKLLHNEHNLITSLGNNIWKITSQLFVDPEGEPYDWRRFKGQKKPTRAALIEKAVNCIIPGSLLK